MSTGLKIPKKVPNNNRFVTANWEPLHITSPLHIAFMLQNSLLYSSSVTTDFPNFITECDSILFSSTLMYMFTDRQTDTHTHTHTHTQTHTQAYRLSVSKMQMFLEYKYYNASINHFYFALKAFSKKHQRVAIVLTWNQTNHSTGLNLPLC